MVASFSGHLAVCELLVDKGADKEAKNNVGYTALILASGHGNTAVCKLLVEKGADKEAKDKVSGERDE
jgi:ankyrin repeat protein